MNARRTLTWIAVAVLGVGLTTAMTITTTLLSQQPIALASEPLSAGNALVAPRAPRKRAPVIRHRPAKHHHRVAHPSVRPAGVSPTQRPAVPLPATTPPAVAAQPVRPYATTVTTRRAPVVSSDDQRSRDRTQSQEGDAQAAQSGADD